MKYLLDRAKVGDFIIQYYGKNGELPPQVELKVNPNEQSSDPNIYLENVLTSTELLYGDYFLKAFEVADNMQRRHNKRLSFPYLKIGMKL